MSFKIPEMQYDKKISKKEGKEILEFTEHYIETFKDDMAEQAYDKVISTGFLGKGPFEILRKRRIQFSNNEIEDPESFYIQKYKPIMSKLVMATENPSSNMDLPKLKDLRDFFERQGYLTKKQMGLISFLLKKFPSAKIKSVPPHLTDKIYDILHHHIKKSFMKVDTAQEIAKMLTKELKEKEEDAIPKKKMFFSLSQIRGELSS